MEDKDPIVEWSKWAAGLSLFAATGCVSIIVGDFVKNEDNFKRIQTAIVIFLISLLFAWLIQLVAAIIKNNYSVNLVPVSSENLRKIMIWVLVPLQIVSFILSVIYLACWVGHLQFKPC